MTYIPNGNTCMHVRPGKSNCWARSISSYEREQRFWTLKWSSAIRTVGIKVSSVKETGMPLHICISNIQYNYRSVDFRTYCAMKDGKQIDDFRAASSSIGGMRMNCRMFKNVSIYSMIYDKLININNSRLCTSCDHCS